MNRRTKTARSRRRRSAEETEFLYVLSFSEAVRRRRRPGRTPRQPVSPPTFPTQPFAPRTHTAIPTIAPSLSATSTRKRELEDA